MVEPPGPDLTKVFGGKAIDGKAIDG